MSNSSLPSTISEPDSDYLLALTTLIKRTGGEVLSTVRGTSMGTTIPDGSQIRIRAVGDEALREGQVVAFLAGPSLCAHRIVYRGGGGRLGGYLLTLGDGWVYCDPPIPVAAALGVVTEYKLNGKWRIPSPRPRRSRAEQRKADLNVAFIRAVMRLNVGWAQRIARRLSELTGSPRLD